MNESDRRHIENLIKALASENVVFKDYSGPEVLALGAAFTWLIAKKKELDHGKEGEQKEARQKQITGSKKKATKKKVVGGNK